MPSQRLIRVNELLKREIAQTLFRLLTHEDAGRITVTQVDTSPNLRQARVYVSIRDEEENAEGRMNLLRRHRKDIQAAIGRNVVLKYNPQLRFVLDTSVREGDRVLSILHDLEETTGLTPDDDVEDDAYDGDQPPPR